MVDFLVRKLGLPSLSWLFGLGVAGCVMVIPLCAYKMFRVLLEKDGGKWRTSSAFIVESNSFLRGFGRPRRSQE